MHVPIPVDDVRAALPTWGIGDAELRELPRGATADVWRVESQQGTFVAKYAYDDRDHFENGLRAAEVALRAGLHSAAPLRTNDGELTVMLEWPTGHWHPLTLLHWVDGVPLSGDEPTAVEDFARIHGTLQAALANELAIDPAADLFSHLKYLENPPPDWREDRELVELAANVAAKARRFQESTPMTIAQAVWDGPEVLVDEDGRLGLIDFGACSTRPVVHAMANRSLHFGLEENLRTRRFAELYLRYYTLTEAEQAGVPIFRKVSIAIYCLYQTSRLARVEVSEHEKREQIQAYVDRHKGLLA